MARPHAKSGQVVSVLPLGEHLSGARTTPLLKADQLEVVRIVLHAGKGLRVLVVNPGKVPAKNAKELQAFLKAKPVQHRLCQCGSGGRDGEAGKCDRADHAGSRAAVIQERAAASCQAREEG